ncbi:hypothetical protein A2Z67_04940 [Candidatus Woesebacteria bacterium RBG_13_36_22]|uniref:DUF5658 domain-containing protein n=1 Tax=Candidatus Woesebacteria bacterium RBG_13_36_22 TaxID=1802478 RepID=A0A1F7X2P7_9BACT|nr:MAG: hypothetical protein A2Z67_04940 [Candidatus Woesebacteria bacterium RBG_13_36_22]
MKKHIGLILGLLLFVLNLIDCLFTQHWVDLGGYGSEMNPLMRFLMEEIGGWWTVPKIFIGLIGGILVAFYWKRFRSVRVATMIVLSVYILLTCYHLMLL